MLNFKNVTWFKNATNAQAHEREKHFIYVVFREYPAESLYKKSVKCISLYTDKSKACGELQCEYCIRHRLVPFHVLHSIYSICCTVILVSCEKVFARGESHPYLPVNGNGCNRHPLPLVKNAVK